MNPEQTINQAVEDVKKEDKCKYNDPCSTRKSYGRLYCLKENTPDCQTAKFWEKFGVDYQFKLAYEKLEPVQPVKRIEDTHDYSIDTLLLVS